LTNADGAEDFKLVTTSTIAPSKSNWVDFYVPETGTKIEDVDIFENNLVIYSKRAAQSVINVVDLEKRGAIPGMSTTEIPLSTGSFVSPGVNLVRDLPYSNTFNLPLICYARITMPMQFA
jgi:oligopeptidase B